MVSSLLARRSTFNRVKPASKPTRSAWRQRRDPHVATYIARRDSDRRRLGHARDAPFVAAGGAGGSAQRVLVAQRRNALQRRDADAARRAAPTSRTSPVRVPLTQRATAHGRPPVVPGRAGSLTEPGRRNTASRRVSGASPSWWCVSSAPLAPPLISPDHAGGVAHDQTVSRLVKRRRRERQARRRILNIVVAAEPLARLGDEVAVAVREHRFSCGFWESSGE